MLQLYRDRYRGFNGRHFHEVVRREHGITWSYSYVKYALQQAGLLSPAAQRDVSAPAAGFRLRLCPAGRGGSQCDLCQEDERVVAPDNTVVVAGQRLQIERQPGRRTCAGPHVRVRQHLDGAISITRPPDVPLAFTVVPSTARPVAVPRRSDGRRIRNPGLGRWPSAKDQFASLFEKRTGSVSNS